MPLKMSDTTTFVGFNYLQWITLIGPDYYSTVLPDDKHWKGAYHNHPCWRPQYIGAFCRRQFSGGIHWDTFGHLYHRLFYLHFQLSPHLGPLQYSRWDRHIGQVGQHPDFYRQSRIHKLCWHIRLYVAMGKRRGKVFKSRTKAQPKNILISRSDINKELKWSDGIGIGLPSTIFIDLLLD